MIGVDVGGTFTDLVLRDGRSGALRSLKTPSTPEDLARGVMNAIALAAVPQSDIAGITHGMTVATNTALEMNGARLGVITTQGFRDVLVVGRGNRTKLYDIKAVRPPPLVPRRRILEVPERMNAAGETHQPLDEDQVAAACQRLAADQVEAIAICFLHSYANPAHEIRAAEIVRAQLPGMPLSLSHEILPEYREFERFSTTALNAYVGPKVAGYLNKLSSDLTSGGIDAPLRIMGSNGGTWRAEAMAAEPVNSMLSGPAGGVTASIGVAKLLGLPDIITYDMGGTSTDACLVRGYRHDMTTEGHVGMWPNRAPQIEIKTVGAGGGSIAYADSGGFLKVGPRSAGAAPGPICYGLGNDEPTVTDANVVMQILNPKELLGGRMPIDRDPAVRAMEKLGEQIGLSTLDTASGIVRVVTANMARAIRLISIQRGHDPREYSLMPFGGGGPVHAGRLARELGMRRILVPRNPGILCALGLLLTDLRHDLSVTRRMVLNAASIPTIRSVMSGLRADADAWFAAENVTPDRQRLVASADMRYAGQNYELSVPIPDLADDAALLDSLNGNFNAAYDRLYDYTSPDEAIEIVTFRVEAYGVVEKPQFTANADAGPDASAATLDPRDVYMPETGEFIETPVYDRDRLQTGNHIAGPAVIEQMDSTTFVLPGQTATIDPYHNIIIEEGAA